MQSYGVSHSSWLTINPVSQENVTIMALQQLACPVDLIKCYGKHSKFSSPQRSGDIGQQAFLLLSAVKLLFSTYCTF